MARTISKFLLVVFIPLVIFFTGSVSAVASNLDVIRGGWYSWKPYQYLELASGDSTRRLTGLDIKLFQEIFEKDMNLKYELKEIGWDVHQQQIKSGDRDVAGGAFFNDERDKYSYYSDPYRTEDIVLVVRRGDKRAENYLNPEFFNSSFVGSNLRLGFVSGYYYGDKVDAVIKNSSIEARLIASENHLQNLQNLVDNKVDVIAIDQLVGGTLVWENKFSDKLTIGNKKIFSEPIYALFSKESTTPAMVDSFNNSLEKIRKNGKYNQIVRYYLFPTLLGMTVGQPWFMLLDNIGTIAFAFSGIILAQKGKFSVFGAVVLASLPAVGGGILRDVIVNRDQPAVLQSAQNVSIVLILVASTYLLMQLPLHRISVFKKVNRIHWLSTKSLIDFFDALGLSAFTVVGVIVAVEAKCDPLPLYAPIFSAMTGAGGSILRDIVRADSSHPYLRKEFYAELSIIWGFMLSVFIAIYANSNIVDPSALRTAVIITTLGCFLSRMYVMTKHIKSPSFMRLRVGRSDL